MRRAKNIFLGFLAFLAVTFGSLHLLAYWLLVPPGETKFITNFRDHRAAFEKIKAMLVADENLVRVGPWGVETLKPFGIFRPTDEAFPLQRDRYNQYLALLKEAGGIVATRNEGAHPDPNVIVWATGFGGDTEHVGIFWADQPPTNQVESLDDYFRKRKPGTALPSVCQHVDGNWYLWSDH